MIKNSIVVNYKYNYCAILITVMDNIPTCENPILAVDMNKLFPEYEFNSDNTYSASYVDQSDDVYRRCISRIEFHIRDECFAVIANQEIIYNLYSQTRLLKDIMIDDYIFEKLHSDLHKFVLVNLLSKDSFSVEVYKLSVNSYKLQINFQKNDSGWTFTISGFGSDSFDPNQIS